jgi:hypothetical protein
LGPGGRRSALQARIQVHVLLPLLALKGREVVLLHLDLTAQLLHFLLKTLYLKQQIGQALIGGCRENRHQGEDRNEQDYR